MQELLNNYSDEIISLTKNIQKNLREHMIKQLKQHNMCDFTIPQLLLMKELHQSPNITLSELSKRLGLAKSTVSGIVDRLEIHGAVSRERASDNRREVRISLTQLAMEKANIIKDIKSTYLNEIFKNLEMQEIEKILEILKTLDLIIKSKDV